MKRLLLSLIILFLINLNYTVSAQSIADNKEFDTAEASIAWLEELYLNRDFEYGVLDGDRLTLIYPESIELQAWHVANMARANQTTEAIELARKMHAANPEDVWATFALGLALRWGDDTLEESLKVIERGLEIDPDFSKFHWLHVAVLNSLEGSESALEQIEHYLETSSEPIRQMEIKGSIMNSMVNQSEDITREDVFEYFAEIRSLDPDNLGAHFFPGIYYSNARQFDKARNLLRKAAEISTATDVNVRHWQSILQSDDLTQEEKRETIEEGMKSLKQRRPITPGLLSILHNTYHNLDMYQERDHYGSRLINEYPDSPQTEWVLIQQQRNFRSTYSDEIADGNTEIIAEYRGLIWNFLGRPHFHNEALKGDAFLSLFSTYRNVESASLDTLEIILNGLEQYNTINPHIVFAEAPATYAEMGGDTDRALQLANRGFDKMKESVDNRKGWGAFDTDEEYEEALNRSYSTIHDAIGWIYFHAGEMEKAEEHLVQSNTLNSGSRMNLFRLGQLYEKIDQPLNAMTYYEMGLSTTGMGNNPNEEAHKLLYEKIHGSQDGYDHYLAEIQDEDRGSRKERILNDINQNPDRIPAFELSNMIGETMNSTELENKIVAINFWGKWCGPCVAEMPYIQELYEHYSDDEEVLILTINNDFDIDDLRSWLNDHDYSFPVLRDSGYITDAGVSVFPTTWFMNRDGEIIYTQLGYTSELVEEFSWRIEELRSR